MSTYILFSPHVCSSDCSPSACQPPRHHVWRPDHGVDDRCGHSLCTVSHTPLPPCTHTYSTCMHTHTHAHTHMYMHIHTYGCKSDSFAFNDVMMWPLSRHCQSHIHVPVRRLIYCGFFFQPAESLSAVPGGHRVRPLPWSLPHGREGVPPIVGQ